MHVRTCTPLLYISVTTGPIKLKFGVWPDVIDLLQSHVSKRGVAARARVHSAHPFFISPEVQA